MLKISIFHNNGDTKMYAGSADWMKRNLSRRIEVIFPIYDEDIKKELSEIIKIQLKDNVKARIVDRYDKNTYVKDRIIRLNQSQLDTHNYLKNKMAKNNQLINPKNPFQD